VEIDRAKRTATFTVKARRAQPADIAGIEAAGAAWYPLQMARELEDAILSDAHQRAGHRHLAASRPRATPPPCWRWTPRC
jgi:hypothetical protein